MVIGQASINHDGNGEQCRLRRVPARGIGIRTGVGLRPDADGYLYRTQHHRVWPIDDAAN
jgi:hypothetical protein